MIKKHIKQIEKIKKIVDFIDDNSFSFEVNGTMKIVVGDITMTLSFDKELDNEDLKKIFKNI